MLSVIGPGNLKDVNCSSFAMLVEMVYFLPDARIVARTEIKSIAGFAAMQMDWYFRRTSEMGLGRKLLQCLGTPETIGMRLLQVLVNYSFFGQH